MTTLKGCCYILRPQTHPNDVMEALNEQRKKQDRVFCDVTLLVEGTPILAHKAVLAACSGYFRHRFIENNEAASNCGVAKPKMVNEKQLEKLTSQLRKDRCASPLMKRRKTFSESIPDNRSLVSSPLSPHSTHTPPPQCFQSSSQKTSAIKMDKLPDGVVILPGVKAKAFSQLLDYMYASSLQIDKDNIQQLLLVSCLLQVQPVLEVCVKIISKETKWRISCNSPKIVKPNSHSAFARPTSIRKNTSLRTSPLATDHKRKTQPRIETNKIQETEETQRKSFGVGEHKSSTNERSGQSDLRVWMDIPQSCQSHQISRVKREKCEDFSVEAFENRGRTQVAHKDTVQYTKSTNNSSENGTRHGSSLSNHIQPAWPRSHDVTSTEKEQRTRTSSNERGTTIKSNEVALDLSRHASGNGLINSTATNTPLVKAENGSSRAIKQQTMTSQCKLPLLPAASPLVNPVINHEMSKDSVDPKHLYDHNKQSLLAPCLKEQNRLEPRLGRLQTSYNMYPVNVVHPHPALLAGGLQPNEYLLKKYLSSLFTFQNASNQPTTRANPVSITPFTCPVFQSFTHDVACRSQPHPQKQLTSDSPSNPSLSHCHGNSSDFAKDCFQEQTIRHSSMQSTKPTTSSTVNDSNSFSTPEAKSSQQNPVNLHNGHKHLRKHKLMSAARDGTEFRANSIEESNPKTLTDSAEQLSNGINGEFESHSTPKERAGASRKRQCVV